MKRFVCVFASLCLMTAAVALAKGPKLSASLYEGKTPQEAADKLLLIGYEQAGKGSWQRLKIARVYYLGGQKDRAEEIFDVIRAGEKDDAGDLIRIGRIYYEAGEWEKAKELFDRVLEIKPKDADWLAEIGAYYNLQGDRDRAEQLFLRSFLQDDDDEKTAAYAAGSYLGVVPNP
jgi:tetratricopeptide (TPR) repeat protein